MGSKYNEEKEEENDEEKEEENYVTLSRLIQFLLKLYRILVLRYKMHHIQRIKQTILIGIRIRKRS